MKRRETRSLVATGCFLAGVLALIAAGVSPVGSRPQPAVAPDLERHVADAQFGQYLAYRVQLENSSNCE